jgi:2-methylcitrate dehydratase PrpD
MATKRVMLDTLASAWAGSTAPGLAELRKGMLGEGSDATLWATGKRGSALDCAFLNGAAAAALDYDALHLDAVVHTDIVLLPALLALAEKEKVDGKTFLAALTAATDLQCRLGKATRDHTGWFYTSIHGVFAAAAGCAMLLKIGEEGIRNALGTALFQVGGTQQSMLEKATTKRLMSAFAARSGLFSAMLAASGVNAPREAFEGKFGFYAMYEAGDPAVVTDALGESWLGTGMSIKKFPSCGCNHAVIEATLQLVKENDLAANDVIGARAVISNYMNRLVGNRYNPGSNPQVAAQFSVQYSVASSILQRRLGVAEIQPDAARDPKTIELAHKVEVVVDDARAGQLAPAEIELNTKSKGWISRRVTTLPGSPENPLSDAELQDKVLECTGLGASPLTPAQTARLSQRVLALETLPDMALLFKDL